MGNEIWAIYNDKYFEICMGSWTLQVMSSCAILFPQIAFYLIENQNSRYKNNLIAIQGESRFWQRD